MGAVFPFSFINKVKQNSFPSLKNIGIFSHLTTSLKGVTPLGLSGKKVISGYLLNTPKAGFISKNLFL